jgi:AcrR family transcriptional regulator/DNA-binding transcriptional ArsR family regulator
LIGPGLLTTDPRTARALAHPARVAILNRLIAHGPATATDCAEVAGLSPSACSYHLRTLARYGFVQLASPGHDGRERVWQVEAPGRLVGLHPEKPNAGAATVRNQDVVHEPDPPASKDWRRFDPLVLDPVLRAAVEAFVELGYHGSTVRDIAARSGLSKPGTYHYYPKKQRVLVAILDMTMADLLERSRAAREEGGLDPVRRFALLVECLALYHTYRRDLAFIGASEMRSLEPANRDRIAALRTEQQGMLDVEVEAATVAGRFTTPFPHEASRALATMCTGLAQWYKPHGPLTPEETAAQYVRFALDLMGHRPAAAGRAAEES